MALKGILIMECQFWVYIVAEPALGGPGGTLGSEDGVCKPEHDISVRMPARAATLPALRGSFDSGMRPRSRMTDRESQRRAVISNPTKRMSPQSDPDRRTGSESRLPKQQRRRRKQRLLTHGIPSLARSIAQAIIIKDEDVFFVAERDGSVPLGGRHGFGLYYHDCRFLNGYCMSLDGQEAEPLVSGAGAGFSAMLELTNPDLHLPGGKRIPKHAVGIKWERVIASQQLALEERLTFTNYGIDPVELPVEFTFQAAFEDIFTVRGFLSGKRGAVRGPSWHNYVLGFLYHGADGICRSLNVRFSRPPSRQQKNRAEFRLALGAGETQQLLISLIIAEAKAPQKMRLDSQSRPGVQQVRAVLRRKADRWISQHTQFRSSSRILNLAMDRSLRDLRVLRSNLEGREYFAAGTPWFATLFGRDSIITALETLASDPGVAEQTLRLLAEYQGHKEDEWRDEQPGKILHELRVGELAHLGEIPHTPYYGTVDATPLFLVLVGQHARWTGDLRLFQQLRPNIELALRWIDEYGDADGDGYVEYRSKSRKGLVNQGWKDSGDAIVNADGSLATPPIALVEVQGYVYWAKQEMAELYRRAGEPETARRLERSAEQLRERFNRDFWVARKGIYALALEASKRQADVISSNPGHALWAGIADAGKARSTMERLLRSDMFTGWGIRTLSSEERRYNPIGYHLGTVWPHDNAIIAAGFRRYGFDAEAARVFNAILEASVHFPSSRLPELFAGFSRAGYATPVRYPVACHPQAWAAGSVPFLLLTALGLQPDAFQARLAITRPVLPGSVHWVELRRLRVGAGRVDLRFQRQPDGRVTVEVLSTSGKLQVEVEPAGAALPREKEKKVA